jgi:hypothetical protein
MNVALQSLLLALITSAGPVLAIWLTGRQRRRETIETWERTDRVAAAARVEAEAQRRSQALIAEEAHSTSVRLDLVHKLVNNTLTVEKERAMLLMRQSLAGARVNMVLLHELGRHDEAERVAVEVSQLEHSIVELSGELSDRARQVASAAPEIEETEAHPM